MQQPEDKDQPPNSTSIMIKVDSKPRRAPNSSQLFFQFHHHQFEMGRPPPSSHDAVDLARLVRRLEKSASPTETTTWARERDKNVWFAAEGYLVKVKHARGLLANVEEEGKEDDVRRGVYLAETRRKLDEMEGVFERIRNESNSPAVHIKPILPTLPLPKDDDEPPTVSLESQQQPAESAAPPTADLLLSPSETLSPPVALPSPPVTQSSSSTQDELIPTLLPSTPTAAPPSTTTSTSTALPTKPQPSFLQNSQQIQQELSEQLAQMASQLKRNAEHFSRSLETDKGVMQGVEEKLDANYTGLTKERVRLRDRRGKALSNTCLVIASVVGVTAVFVLMAAVIRVT